ncbi:MAG TPA: glucose 1-dehydrogenase [Gemmatimonadaceae bacterium]|nr:glucose 1-dehydrogenase [Gemmatimonadaceae bacterium]
MTTGQQPRTDDVVRPSPTSEPAPGQRRSMKAIAVTPGTPNSIHLRDVPLPSHLDVPGGRGVLVKVLRVGVDGTDKEIDAAEYGMAPPGDDYLIIGHESLGVVEAVAPAVMEVRPGDYVAASVRRPGSSIYDRIGLQDMTTDDTYFERGINLRHGFLAEYYAESAEYLVTVPRELRDVGVLMEPTSVAEKAIGQAYEIQRRLRVWQPRRGLVLGSGTLGLLASLFLRLRGVEVVTMGRTPPPYLNSDLLEEIGARYLTTTTTSVADAAARHGPFDIIIEGTGVSRLVFEAMEALGKNGVLVMVSVTGGDHTVEISADRINLGFVLGNKVAVGSVNASRADFERGVLDLAHAQLAYPGWLAKLLTHPVRGLERYRELLDTLTMGKSMIKVYCEVAPMEEQ